MDRKQQKNEAIICPRCEGYGYLDREEIPGDPCITCGGSGWMMKSQLAEWESEDCLDEELDQE